MADEATARLLVEGVADTEMPLRVLNLFAVQDVTIDSVALVREGEQFRLTIASTGTSADQRDRIVQRARVLVLVEDARWD